MPKLIKILAVDEDPDFTTLTKLSLDPDGQINLLEIRENRDIGSATQDFIPDLVFIDIAPDHSDGEAIIQGLESDHRTRHIPVIQLTNTDPHHPRHEGRERTRGRQCLTKPLRKDQLLQSIQEHLQGEDRDGI